MVLTVVGGRLPLRGGLKKAVKCVEAAEQLFRVHLDAIFALQVKRGGWRVGREENVVYMWLKDRC